MVPPLVVGGLARKSVVIKFGPTLTTGRVVVTPLGGWGLGVSHRWWFGSSVPQNVGCGFGFLMGFFRGMNFGTKI